MCAIARVLYIISSPQDRSHSYSRRVSDAFIETYKEANDGDEIDVLNVSEESLPEFGALAASWKLSALAGQPPTDEEAAHWAEIKGTTDRFLAADKYVFSMPVWNFHIPYRLKHYLDLIVQPGITFTPEHEGLVPSERPVQLIIASGGAYEPGSPGESMNFFQPYLEGLLGYIGLRDIRTLLVGCTAYGPEIAGSSLSRSVEEAIEAAKDF